MTLIHKVFTMPNYAFPLPSTEVTHLLFIDEKIVQFSDLKSSIESKIRKSMESKVKPSLFSTGSNLGEVQES